MDSRSVQAETAGHGNNTLPTIYRENTRGHSDPNVFNDAGEKDRVPIYHRRQPTAQQQRDDFVYRRDVCPPTSAFANNNRESNQFGLNRRDPGQIPSAFTYKHFEYDLRGAYRREDDPLSSAYANNNNAPNRFDTHRQGHRQSFEPLDVFRQPQLRNSHNSVPVNHWKISFSGDGQGLHLFDILSQVKMLQQSEMIPVWQVVWYFWDVEGFSRDFTDRILTREL